MSLAITVLGANGRLGQHLLSLIEKDDAFSLAFAYHHRISDLRESIAGADLIIDFSLAGSTSSHLLMAASHKKAFILGTTAISPRDHRVMKECSKEIPILYDSNYSLGALAMKKAAAFLDSFLPKSWDADIIERHHKNKKDAPSGTALNLQAAMPRHKTSIHSLRSGSCPGEHQLCFSSHDESLSLSHRVDQPACFARGALEAAKILISSPPALYDFDDLF